MITNFVVIDGVTNNEIFDATDNPGQVASFSARGNVGIEIEGDVGRFKPDLVAPGTFVISDRSQEWDSNRYYNPTTLSLGLLHEQCHHHQRPDGNFIVGVPGRDDGNPHHTATTNSLTLSGLPTLPIYVNDNDFASTAGTNWKQPGGFFRPSGTCSLLAVGYARFSQLAAA